MLKSSSFGLLLPLVFLIGTCVLVLILSFYLSLISYYTKLYANWLSDPKWYHFYFNWYNSYCYSFSIPLFVALAQIPDFSLKLIGVPLSRRYRSHTHRSMRVIRVNPSGLGSPPHSLMTQRLGTRAGIPISKMSFIGFLWASPSFFYPWEPLALTNNISTFNT